MKYKTPDAAVAWVDIAGAFRTHNLQFREALLLLLYARQSCPEARGAGVDGVACELDVGVLRGGSKVMRGDLLAGQRSN